MSNRTGCVSSLTYDNCGHNALQHCFFTVCAIRYFWTCFGVQHHLRTSDAKMFRTGKIKNVHLSCGLCLSHGKVRMSLYLGFFLC